MSMSAEQAELLAALAGFLEKLPAAVNDPGQAFRVRIAAWLTAGLARSAALEPGHTRARITRLGALLALAPPAPGEEPGWLEAAERRLAHLLRTDALDEAELAAARAHVRASLEEDLAIAQPGFDRRLDLEGR